MPDKKKEDLEKDLGPLGSEMEAEMEAKEEEVTEASEDDERLKRDADLILQERNERIKKLEEEVSRLKEERLREAAETENFKKRARDEKERAIQFANESLIKDLIEPLNNFSIAIEASNTNDVEGYKKGVEMVEDQMLSMLKSKWGVETIGKKGEKYDANDMQALSIVEKEGIEDDEVEEVISRGYKFHGKVLRPASVVVAKPKA